jgi:NAD(P)-dependent dehydrogenase (short-subunit alcohol dehydrogenase family)
MSIGGNSDGERLLNGRGVVITGAGRGLGRAFAVDAARHGAGVVVNDVDADVAQEVVQEIEAAGGQAVAAVLSVAEPDSAVELVRICVERFGSIDGLVNNAVAYTHFGPAWEEEPDQTAKMVAVAFTGAVNCGVQAIRTMREQGSGVVVNVSSRGMMGIKGIATYTATKGAMASLTYGWAMDLEGTGVRCNGLAPGALTRAHEWAGGIATYAKTTADSPEQVAPAVTYMLSDLAANMNGQIVALMGRKLGIMRPPAMIEIEDRDHWSPQEIAEIFADGRFEQPVGILAGQAALQGAGT